MVKQAGFIKLAFTRRRYQLHLALLAACSTASGANVVVDPSSTTDGWTDARITGQGGGITTNANGSTLGAGTSMVIAVPQASRQAGSTPATTADASTSGAYSSTPTGTTFTTSGSVSGNSNNIGVLYDGTVSGGPYGLVQSRAESWVESYWYFDVTSLSSYNWSAVLSGSSSGNAYNYGEAWFGLKSVATNTFVFNAHCWGASCSFSNSGSGQLLAGTYALGWGTFSWSDSYNVDDVLPYAPVGDKSGSISFSQRGELTVTEGSAVPAAVWLLLSGLGGLGLLARPKGVAATSSSAQ